MNYKLLALILIFSLTIFNFNNCADKARVEVQAKPFFGPGSLAELVKEFKDIKEYSQDVKDFDPNFKQFKERALKLFDKFNKEALKQKIGSIKYYRAFLSQTGLYPEDKIDLEGQPAIKAFENTLEDEFYNVLGFYFRLKFGPYNNKYLLDAQKHLLDFIQIMPISIGNKKLELSNIFNSQEAAWMYAENSNLSVDQIVKFLVLVFGKNLNKPAFFSKHVGLIPLLIVLAGELETQMRKFSKQKPPFDGFDKLEKLENIIKALLRLPEIDIHAKDSRGYAFADYANGKDKNDDYVFPELHQIYQEYIEERQDALKEGVQDALPIPELRDLVAGYVN